MGEYYLELTNGADAGNCYKISGESAVIGRADSCAIRLNDVRGVSRNHCRVYNDTEGLRVVDLESQNGVIVQGKKVKEAIVGPGVTLQIGEAIFKVNITALAAAGSVGLATVGDNLPDGLAPAPGLDLAQAPTPGAIDPADAIGNFLEGTGESGKNVFLQLFVVIGLIFGGLYALQYVSKSPRRSYSFAIVKAHQPKAVNFSMDFDSYSILGKNKQSQDIISARDYRGLLVPSLKRLSNNPRAPKVRMLVITGIREGEAQVVLKNKSGTPIKAYRIVCRGIDPYRVPPDITQEDARDMAARALAQARRFARDDKEYDAWVQYHLAAQLYNGPANDVDEGGNTGVEALSYKRRLSEKLCAIFDEAMTTAFPTQSRIRAANYKNALVLLEDARNLIPDEDSVDRQVIENWMIIINTLDKRQRKQRR